MIADELNKFESLIIPARQYVNVHIHNYQLLINWGLFTEETAKALIASTMEGEQLYEKHFRQADTAITSQLETFLNWLLDQGVLIPQPSEVRNYLLRYFDLTRILRSTCKLAIEWFVRPSQLSLEVYRDPEIEDRYLTLYIRQPQYNEDILERIEKLRAEYEMDLTDSPGWFLVTTDFRPPL
ncbi:MAG: hypothetical protein ACRERE_10875 [Candidatus Entotheonellia bacterium]